MHFGVFDIEARQWNDFRLAVTLLDGKTEVHRNLPDLYKALQGKGCIWYAHNGGQYDFHFLLDALARGGISASCVYHGGRVYEVRSAGMVLRDSFPLLCKGLGSLEKAFGLPCTPYAYDLAEDAETESHCVEDCRNLATILTTYFDWTERTFKVRPGMSLAATSIRSALQGVRVPTLRKKDETIARQALYGGRCEVFSHETEGPGFEYDLNSAYPWATSLPIPWEGAVRLHRLLDRDTERFAVFVDATIETRDDLYVGPLPYKPRDRNRPILYPLGKWRGWYAWPDLRALLESGGKILTVHDTRAWAVRPAFESYVGRLYALRAGSQEPYSTWLKLALNGLWGKCAQQRSGFELLVHPDPKHLDGLEAINLELGLFARRTTGKWHPFMRPQIAAWITATVRERLYRDLRCAGPWYCDTDSIHCAGPLSVGPGLGAFKVATTFDTGVWIAPKVYALRQSDGQRKWKVKGAKVSQDDFNRLARGKKISLDAGFRTPMQARRFLETQHKTFQFRGLESRNRQFYSDGTPSRPLQTWEIETGEATRYDLRLSGMLIGGEDHGTETGGNETD